MTTETPDYEHLVISGGGIAGICLYTAIRDSQLHGEWRHENIKSIHAVSAGTVIAVIIALRYEWSVIDEYIINRPLHNLFKWQDLSLMNVFYNCGMIDRAVFVDALRPIFAGAGASANIDMDIDMDIDIDITMRDFREKTGISLHFYCTELFGFEKVEMSADTTPDLAVIDAIYRSCTIPFIMVPQRGAPAREGERAPLYVDGYLKTNYPSRDCMDAGVQEDKIIGFRLKTPYTDVKNMIDLAKSIIFAIGNAALCPIKHEHVIDHNCFGTLDDIYLFFKSPARRREIINPLS